MGEEMQRTNGNGGAASNYVPPPHASDFKNPHDPYSRPVMVAEPVNRIEAVHTDGMRSASIGKIAGALSKAQGKMRLAAKDSNNPFFGSKYADLGSVWEAAREALAENELAVVQVPEGDVNGVVLTTLLIHSSDQWMKSVLKIKPVKADPQGIGSAITYARRYALAAMVGIASDDDDGNAASGNTGEGPRQGAGKNSSHAGAQGAPAQEKSPATSAKPQARTEMIGPNQIKMLDQMLGKIGLNTKSQKFLDFLGVEFAVGQVAELRMDQMKGVIDRIQVKINAAEAEKKKAEPREPGSDG